MILPNEREVVDWETVLLKGQYVVSPNIEVPLPDVVVVD